MVFQLIYQNLICNNSAKSIAHLDGKDTTVAFSIALRSIKLASSSFIIVFYLNSDNSFLIDHMLYPIDILLVWLFLKKQFVRKPAGAIIKSKPSIFFLISYRIFYRNTWKATSNDYNHILFRNTLILIYILLTCISYSYLPVLIFQWKYFSSIMPLAYNKVCQTNWM